MILTWSINVFLTRDQKVLQFLFRQDAFLACRFTADNKPRWFVALRCSTPRNKRWPDLFPFAFLQHCCGTRRCCSQPEGHAMLWMALPMEKYLEIGSKVSQRRRKHFSQNPKCHRVGTNTVFPSIDLQLGSPLPADPDCLTQTHSHWLDWTVVFSPPGRAEKGGEKSTSSSWDSFKTKGRAEVLSDCRQL